MPTVYSGRVRLEGSSRPAIVSVRAAPTPSHCPPCSSSSTRGGGAHRARARGKRPPPPFAGASGGVECPQSIRGECVWKAPDDLRSSVCVQRPRPHTAHRAHRRRAPALPPPSCRRHVARDRACPHYPCHRIGALYSCALLVLDRPRPPRVLSPPLSLWRTDRYGAGQTYTR